MKKLTTKTSGKSDLSKLTVTDVLYRSFYFNFLKDSPPQRLFSLFLNNLSQTIVLEASFTDYFFLLLRKRPLPGSYIEPGQTY